MLHSFSLLLQSAVFRCQIREKTDRLESALPGQENMVLDEQDDPSA